MKCNAKTMIMVAVVLGAALVAAYLALPEARTLVLASAPILLALVCPIAMIVMLVGKGSTTQQKDPTGPMPDEGKPPGVSADPVPGVGAVGPHSAGASARRRVP